MGNVGLEVFKGGGPSTFIGVTLDLAYAARTKRGLGHYFLYLEYRYFHFEDTLTPVGDANLFFSSEVSTDFSTHYVGVGFGFTLYEQ